MLTEYSAEICISRVLRCNDEPLPEEDAFQRVLIGEN